MSRPRVHFFKGVPRIRINLAKINSLSETAREFNGPNVRLKTKISAGKRFPDSRL